jgi:hypothetical protein
MCTRTKNCVRLVATRKSNAVQSVECSFFSIFESSVPHFTPCILTASAVMHVGIMLVNRFLFTNSSILDHAYAQHRWPPPMISYSTDWICDAKPLQLAFHMTDGRLQTRLAHASTQADPRTCIRSQHATLKSDNLRGASTLLTFTATRG